MTECVRQHLTSDLHKAHKGIMEYCPNRPGDSLEDMWNNLVANWNKRVRPWETVFILGDMAFKKDNGLKMLNGNKILIVGNHDHSDMINWALREQVIVTALTETTTRFNHRNVYLSHYPKKSWPGSTDGSILFHGHTHGSLAHHEMGWRQYIPNMLDVGVDCDYTDFGPITTDRAIQLADKRTKQIRHRAERSLLYFRKQVGKVAYAKGRDPNGEECYLKFVIDCVSSQECEVFVTGRVPMDEVSDATPSSLWPGYTCTVTTQDVSMTLPEGATYTTNFWSWSYMKG